MRRVLTYLLVLLAIAAGIYLYRPSLLPRFLPVATPWEEYVRALERAGLSETALVRDWKAEGERAVREPTGITLPAGERLEFPAAQVRAAGYRVSLRRGRVLQVSTTSSGEPARVFIDLFAARSDGTLRHVASAPADATSLEREIDRDGDYIVRVQPELLRTVTIAIRETTRAALTFPVSGRDSRAVQSFFRDPRDAGRRDHHGVDIFAPRGTPVVAAAGGVVTSVGTTNLGGKVVWVWDARRSQSHYYAHLSGQAVRSGAIVHAGDVVGYVGNTGNARTTPPHLHFGIYSVGEGPIDPLPFVQGATGAEITPDRTKPDDSRRRQRPGSPGSAESGDR